MKMARGDGGPFVFCLSFYCSELGEVKWQVFAEMFPSRFRIGTTLKLN